MRRSYQRRSRLFPNLEERCFAVAVYVLVPGLVLGELAAQLTSGSILAAVLMPLIVGAGGFFGVAVHLYAAEKAGATFLLPVIAAIAVLLGIAYFWYGASVYLAART
jgi:hypothetical protein